jgi:SAM-dependent methyltransferase
VRWKVQSDPLYAGVLEALRGYDQPLIDVGCGVGLLAFFLREHGYDAPIIGIDFDDRKIDLARKAAANYRAIDFIRGDARAPLPPGHNVLLLDVLHYFDPASQQVILRNAAEAVPPGGVAVIRQGIRDRSWRYRMSSTVDAFGRAIRWMRAENLIYPTREEVLAPFAGFDAEVRPLWGRTPYNNYLFVLRRAASSGMTKA